MPSFFCCIKKPKPTKDESANSDDSSEYEDSDVVDKFTNELDEKIATNKGNFTLSGSISIFFIEKIVKFDNNLFYVIYEIQAGLAQPKKEKTLTLKDNPQVEITIKNSMTFIGLVRVESITKNEASKKRIEYHPAANLTETIEESFASGKKARGYIQGFYTDLQELEEKRVSVQR